MRAFVEDPARTGTKKDSWAPDLPLSRSLSLVRPLATKRNGEDNPDAMTSINGPVNKARRESMVADRRPSRPRDPSEDAVQETRDEIDKRHGIVRTTYEIGRGKNKRTVVRIERTTELDDDAVLPHPCR